MQLTTNQRHEALIRKSNSKPKPSELGLCPFIATPEIIIFQCFVSGPSYTVQLRIRNTTFYSQPLRMIFEKNPVLDITPAISPNRDVNSNRLAPGIAAIFNIKFTPEDVRDYHHKVSFMIEGGTLDIPIYAIGPRPLIDIPDLISIPVGAVNIPSEKMIVVRNFGKLTAYKFITKPPFFIHPTEGVLTPYELVQLRVEFKSLHVGEATDHMVLSFDNGEDLYIDLVGGAQNIEVYLEKDSLTMCSTYITLSSERKLKIFNQ